MNSRQAKLIVTEWWLPGAGGWKKQGDAGWQMNWGTAGQRVQTFSCKMNKFWKPNVQHGDYS